VGTPLMRLLPNLCPFHDTRMKDQGVVAQRQAPDSLSSAQGYPTISVSSVGGRAQNLDTRVSSMLLFPRIFIREYTR